MARGVPSFALIFCNPSKHNLVYSFVKTASLYLKIVRNYSNSIFRKNVGDNFSSKSFSIFGWGVEKGRLSSMIWHASPQGNPLPNSWLH